MVTHSYNKLFLYFTAAVVGSEPQAITSIIPSASLQSLIDTTNQAGAVTSVDCTNPVAVLASVAANTNSVNQLQAHQLQNIQIPAQVRILLMLLCRIFSKKHQIFPDFNLDLFVISVYENLATEKILDLTLVFD
jgi:hypothetical protein